MDVDRLPKFLFDNEYQMDNKNGWCNDMESIFDDINMSDLYLQQKECNINEYREHYIDIM